ncbi:HPr(Ser) kinase/phosphatase [[Mycoplasma] testudinis]|uniref:HPr(Ser) kinase/phosphatase n=1 Tax=[Mycoplasma] testudinis TaxID=33924 RepID=UPI000A016C57|nr:HPr(Ser) kinase/phosphatase [[Mycoplasma] testudinis]
MLTVEKLLQKFELSLAIIDGQKNIKNAILKPGINRVGFELLGFFVDKQIKNVIVFGNREYTYLLSLKADDCHARLANILKANPPAIILTQSFKKTDFLKKVNEKYQVPIISSDMFSNDIASSVGTYISERLASYETIHGVLIEVFGAGVLIIGESGIGKSEIAMEMIKKNHLFIADDAVDVARIGGSVLGKANIIAKNFIEVRGLGILNIAKMFGIEKIKDAAHIAVVVEIVNINNKQYDFERLGAKMQFKNIKGIRLPYYLLPISPGRKASDLIESVVIDLKLKREGYNSALDFIETKNRGIDEDEAITHFPAKLEKTDIRSSLLTASTKPLPNKRKTMNKVVKGKK